MSEAGCGGPANRKSAIAESERTKAVVYRTHTFFTVYGVSTTQTADETESMLDVHRICGFVLPRGLITVRLSPHFDIDAVSQRFDELGGQEYGVGSLVHGLLDVVVDGHFEAVQALDDGIEAIEGELFENNARSGLQRRMFRLRKDLVELLRRRPNWTRCTRICTTTSCGRRSGQSRCGTWSRRCSRRTCRCGMRG
jgi:magnesium transporter